MVYRFIKFWTFESGRNWGVGFTKKYRGIGQVLFILIKKWIISLSQEHKKLDDILNGQSVVKMS